MVGVAAEGDALVKEATSLETLAQAPVAGGAELKGSGVLVTGIKVVGFAVAGAVTVPLPVGPTSKEVGAGWENTWCHEGLG